MEGNAPTIEWYLARDGQQHGPLTDTEMRKFVELGHLRETDLVWRAGFTEWRPSTAVFQLGGAAARDEARQGPASGSPSERVEQRDAAPARGRRRGQPPAERAAAEPEPEIEIGGNGYGVGERTRTVRTGRRRRSGAVGAVVSLLLLSAVAAGGWLAWENRDRFGPITSLGGLVATASNNTSDSAMRVSPFAVTGVTGDAVDAALQRTAVWRLAKRDFPDWYAARVQQVGKIVAENGDEKTVARVLAESLVALRREHASTALSAPLPALRKIASSFVDNLSELSKIGAQQCFGFISFGEGTPMVVDLARTPAHAEHLQRQMVAVLEAAGEGRRTAMAHAQARRSDYDMLSWELAKRNWTREDLQTFSNSERLAALPPEGICKMVYDWFSAHLDVIDQDAQARLLAQSLKPLVAG